MLQLPINHSDTEQELNLYCLLRQRPRPRGDFLEMDDELKRLREEAYGKFPDGASQQVHLEWSKYRWEPPDAMGEQDLNEVVEDALAKLEHGSDEDEDDQTSASNPPNRSRPPP